MLGEVSQAGSLGRILTDKAIGVLIGTSLPGMVGCGKEEIGTGSSLDLLVAMKLRAVVDRDGADTSAGVGNEGDGPSVGGLDGTGAELGDHDIAGLTIDEREDAVLIDSQDGIALQVTNAGPVLGTRWPLRDGFLTSEPASRVVATVSFAALLSGTPEMDVEGPTPLSVGPDVAVDGLVTDGELALPTEPAGDLLRTQILPEPCLNELPVGRLKALITTRPGASAARHLIGSAGPVRTVLSGIPSDLATDRASVPTKGASDRRRTKSLFPER